MVTVVELAVLALAAYRATQLFVYDTVGDPARNRLHVWHARRPDSAARGWVIALISCVYCTGWWLSGATLAAYLTATGGWGAAPWLVHGIEWFAVAGAAALLNRWDDHLDAPGGGA